MLQYIKWLVAMKDLNGVNYLTLAKHNTAMEASKLKIVQQNDVPDKTRQLKVQFPTDGVKKKWKKKKKLRY